MSDRLRAKDNFFRIAFIGDDERTKSWHQAFHTNMVDTMVIKPSDDIQLMVDWGPNMVMICQHDDLDKLVPELVPVINGLVVIKPTLSPDKVGQLVARDRKVVYFPDLTSASNDVVSIHNPHMMLAGGDPESLQHLEQVVFGMSKIIPSKFIRMTGVEAAFAKLGIDSFLATKVAFFNQMHINVSAFGGMPSSVARAIASDHRIGISHTIVPGYDNKPGYGPSLQNSVDLLADFAYNKDQDLPMFSLLNEVTKINDELRGHTNVDNGQTEEEQ